MATDHDVLALVGLEFPPYGSPKSPCDHCRIGAWVIIGPWHPSGPDTAAFVVLGCPRCGSTCNGGAP